MSLETVIPVQFDPATLVVSASLSLRKNEVRFDQEFLESIENLPEISESIEETEAES